MGSFVHPKFICSCENTPFLQVLVVPLLPPQDPSPRRAGFMVEEVGGGEL